MRHPPCRGGQRHKVTSMRKALFAFSVLLGGGALSLVLFAPWTPWLPLLGYVLAGVFGATFRSARRRGRVTSSIDVGEVRDAPTVGP